MGGVHRLAAATEAEMAADPVGDRPGLAAGQGLAADLGHRGEGRGGLAQGPGPLGGRDIPGGQRGGEHGADERPPGPQRRRAGDLTGQRVPDDHPGPVPGESLPAGEAGVRERPARRLQGQPVGRVGGQVGVLGDAEPGPVELPSLEHARPGGRIRWPSRPGRHRGQRPGPRPRRAAPAAAAGTRAVRPGRSRRAPADRQRPGTCRLGRRWQSVLRCCPVRCPQAWAQSGPRSYAPAIISFLVTGTQDRPATSIVSPEKTDLAAFARTQGYPCRRWPAPALTQE